MLRTIAILTLATGLAACGSTGGEFVAADDQTNSRFAQGAPFGGTFGSTLSSPVEGGDINSALQGYGYEVGGGLLGGFSAQAGLLSTTSVQAPPSNTTLTYSGRYEAASITGIRVEGDNLLGQSQLDSGNISLIANFQNRSLVGSTDRLSVNGQIIGSELSGNVTYRGVSGALEGQVGSDAAIGAFHGNNDTTVFAGGFIVEAP